MRRLPLLLLALAACEKNDPLFCEKNPTAEGCGMTGDGGNGDGSGSSTADAQVNFGAGAYTIHLGTLPTAPVDLTTQVTPIDTAGSMCSPDQLWSSGSSQTGACFIVGTRITIPASEIVAFTGPRPLVLVATNDIVIAGTLDVGSHAGNGPGPGAPDGACDTGTPPANSTGGGGGGAGGSFMSIGGAGGAGNTAGTTAAGQPGAALTVAPTVLRGGCSGQGGGTGGSGGGAGEGGGGVYLVAGSAIDLRTGHINASGGGGSHGTNKGGGGGGGAGGMIVLYAPSIMTDANTRIAANGGGGAAGANANNAGQDGSITSPTTAASGGAATSGCGNLNAGGAGAAGTTAATAGGTVAVTCGGGGGGGGIGYIQSNMPLTAGVFSPMPTTP